MWNETNILTAKDMFEAGATLEEISKQIGKTPKAVRLYFNRKLDLYFSERDLKPNLIKKCAHCTLYFESRPFENRKFCSKSCAGSVNGKLFPKRAKTEAISNVRIKTKSIIDKKEKREIRNKIVPLKVITEEERWLLKEEFAKRGLLTHKQMREFLIHLHGPACMDCGWCKVNPVSNKVPIQLEHVDGDSENNTLTNVKLLCPNCHSLTSTFGTLNMGKGRKTRRVRRIVA